MPDYDVTRIAGNIGATNALNSLSNINKQLATYQSRLATGKRINSAADDPAGLTIATKMLARSEGLKTALSNIGDAKNLLAVAEAGLGRINDILVQMRNKAETGASDTMGVSERKALVQQMQAYSKQIDDIVGQTKWTSSSPSLIDGTYDSTALTFQTGADKGETTTLSGLKNMKASGAGGLELATSVTSVAGEVSNEIDSGSLVHTLTAAAGKTNSNLDELATGTYTVSITYGANAAAGATIKLYSGATASGTALLIDANNNTADEPVDSQVATGTLAADVAVDLGNGVQFTVEADSVAANVSTTKTFTFNYTQTGTNTYTLKTGGVGGTTIDENSSATQFANYMNDIQTKLDKVSEQLSMIGALTGRLTFKEDQVSAAQINTESAYNRIMNANMAEEQVNASKFTILQQTSTAMLAQANAAPQFLLSLFQ